MKVAVITPYYKEPLGWLERCHQSVVKQTYQDVRHFMIADGFPNEAVTGWSCEHVVLPNSGDFGDTPRGVGAAVAAAQGCDAICFLDADCWYEPDHIEQLLSVQCRSSASIVTCPRNLYSPNGVFMCVDRESNGDDFNDTNCYLITSPVFACVRAWMLKDKNQSMVGDRIFWLTVKQMGISTERALQATVNYTTNFAAHYINSGHPPPLSSKVIADTKDGKKITITWAQYLQVIEQQKQKDAGSSSLEVTP